MLSKEMQGALNAQITREFHASYLYLAMSAYCETKSFEGFAKWLQLQSQEEWEHGMRLYKHILDRGGTVVLDAIEAPPSEFGTPLEVFEKVLAHEQKVTKLIDELYAKAAEEKDYATQIELQWFVTEQVEEERNAEHIIALLKMVDAREAALLVLDKHLGKRSEG